MPIFIERFLLPVMVLLVGTVGVTNPMKWNVKWRITGGLAILVAAWFLSYSLQLENEKLRIQPSKGASEPAAKHPGSASDSTPAQNANNSNCANTQISAGGSISSTCEVSPPKDLKK